MKDIIKNLFGNSNKKSGLAIIAIITILASFFLINTSLKSFEYKEEPERDYIIEQSIVKIHYIDVGQADSIFIDIGDYDILIDAGNNSDGDLVVDYLQNLGVDDIEILIATHVHEDHIGGLDDVIEAFDIENIIDSGQDYTTKTFRDYLEAVQNENVTYFEDEYIEYIITDQVKFVIYETGDNYSNTNDNSVVCVLFVNDRSFLFTGDMEEKAELASLDIFFDVDVLKVGHHGSDTATCDEFLDIVKPEFSVISCGVDNKYGHPHSETIEKLEAINSQIYRTDLLGTIVLIIEQNEMTWEFQNN